MKRLSWRQGWVAIVSFGAGVALYCQTPFQQAIGLGPRPDLLPPQERPPALGKTVSLVVRAQPLEAVLEELSRKSGTRLALSPKVKAEKLRVTMRFRQTPLGVVMASIARVFALTWKQDKDVLVLSHYPPDLVGPGLRSLMRRGDEQIIARQFHEEWVEVAGQFQDALMRNLTQQQVRVLQTRGQGLLIKELPQEVQEAALALHEFNRLSQVCQNARAVGPDEILATEISPYAKLPLLGTPRESKRK